MTRGEMMHRMTAGEFDTWAAYSQLWPLGDKRADFRIGILASAIVNALIGIWTKETPNRKPHDYMPFADADEMDNDDPPPPDEVVAKVEAVFTGTIPNPSHMDFGYDDF